MHHSPSLMCLSFIEHQWKTHMSTATVRSFTNHTYQGGLALSMAQEFTNELNRDFIDSPFQTLKDNLPYQVKRPTAAKELSY